MIVDVFCLGFFLSNPIMCRSKDTAQNYGSLVFWAPWGCDAHYTQKCLWMDEKLTALHFLDFYPYWCKAKCKFEHKILFWANCFGSVYVTICLFFYIWFIVALDWALSIWTFCLWLFKCNMPFSQNIMKGMLNINFWERFSAMVTGYPSESKH